MAHVTTILNVPRSLGESKHGKLSIGACKSMKNDITTSIPLQFTRELNKAVTLWTIPMLSVSNRNSSV